MDKYTEEELDRIRDEWMTLGGFDIDALRSQRAHLLAVQTVPIEILENDPMMGEIVAQLSAYILQRPHEDLNKE